MTVWPVPPGFPPRVAQEAPTRRLQVLGLHGVPYGAVSSSALRRERSFVVARRIARSIIGALSRENPDGFPRLRRVIRVAVSPTGSQVYVVSIGNGPSAVRITSRRAAWSSTTS